MANAALRAPLVGVMESRQPEERLQRVWLRVRARREAKRHRGFWQANSRLILAAAAGTCVVVLAAWSLRLGWLRTPSTHASSSTPVRIEPDHTPRSVDFGDGAVVNVHAGARLDVLEQSDHSVVLALRRGLSHFDIRPGGARRWRIDCGAVTVEVVGTRFSVERRDSSVRVAVERGRVLVRGAGVPDQVQSLEARHSIVIDSGPVASANASSATPPELSAESALEPVPPPASTRNHAGAHPPATEPSSTGGDWHSAANRQDWNQAWQTLGSDGVARVAAHTDDVAELLALADVARLSGHPQHALTPLRLIVGSHSQDPRAAMAAFTLGRVLLDGLGQPMQASFALERALALKLPAALDEDALARLVEAHAKAGAAAQARASAATYRTRYPAGRRLADVNRWSPAE
jgi:transmembrane sensor